jgi:hypothetical protein
VQYSNRIKSLIESWKKRPDYIKDIRHPKIHNCWRSFMFTRKGKLIGSSEEWKNYRNFYNDVISTYKEGFTLQRPDKKKPFCKDNFLWCSHEVAANMRDGNILLEYQGSKKTFREWSNLLGIPIGIIKLRHYRHKEYTSKEILFGKKRLQIKKLLSISELSTQRIRDKASKMCSSYRFNDRRRGYQFDIDKDWLIKNILSKPCTYCGSTDFVGCDRVDNSKGHIKTNVVPCCVVCNMVKGNNFNFEEMKIIGDVIREIKEKRKRC